MAPGRFVLYRILGNDLAPRHGRGQTLANLAFTLEHEPPLAHCERRWIVNRVADAAMEAEILRTLERHRQAYARIPFVADEYLACEFDFDGLPAERYLHARTFAALSDNQRTLTLEWCYRRKNRYLTNVNGARNTALREGRALADWVLPFDSGCFFTAAAWAEFLEAAGRAGAAHYLIVPIARVADNARVLDPSFRPAETDEPQIAFARHAAEEFDERLRYGVMSKTALLNRLGVPGPWEGRAGLAWDPVDLAPSREAGCFAYAGWVARLATGNAPADAERRVRNTQRWLSIAPSCLAVQAQILRRRFPPEGLCFFDEQVLERRREAWRRAEPALAPIVEQMRADAEPAGKIRQIDDLTRCGLGWYFTGEDRLAQRGAALARALFIDPASRLDPGAPAAQRSAHRQAGMRRALLGLQGFAHALDGVRLLERAGALAAEEIESVRTWFRAFLDWLYRSEAGRLARASPDHVGTAFDLHVVAASLFVGNLAMGCAWLDCSRMRIAQQVDAAGRQPHERGAAQGRHGELLNLQLWANLARLGRAAGTDLWAFTTRDGRGLGPALVALGESLGSAPAGDASRVRLAILRAFVAHGTDVRALPARPPADWGVAPFWSAGIP